jgi:hypothetical protein
MVAELKVKCYCEVIVHVELDSFLTEDEVEKELSNIVEDDAFELYDHKVNNLVALNKVQQEEVKKQFKGIHRCLEYPFTFQIIEE